MKTKTNYYENQLKRINVTEGHTPSININHQTNWMDINEESAPVLIEYLKKFLPKEPRYRYYIFGMTASEQYQENFDIEDVTLPLDGEIFKLDPDNTDPSEILLAYDGWGGFWEISEDEYNRLNDKLNSLSQ